MHKATVFVWLGFGALSLQAARAQTLPSGPDSAVRTEQGGMLAGQARGLHPAFAARMTSPAVMDADEDRSALPMQVMFEPGSARLTVSATRMLDHLGQALSNGPLANERIRVEGHADAGGSADANRDISERRAMAVAAYLEENFAIRPGRVACIGLGSSAPSERIVLVSRLTSG